MLQVGLKCKHSFVDFDLFICVHVHLYMANNKKRKSAVCLKRSDRWDSLISSLSALPGEHFSTKPWLLTSLSGDKTYLSYPASQTSKSLQGSEMFKIKKIKNQPFPHIRKIHKKIEHIRPWQTHACIANTHTRTHTHISAVVVGEVIWARLLWHRRRRFRDRDVLKVEEAELHLHADESI